MSEEFHKAPAGDEETLHTRLCSVGIDVGSATTHLTLSELVIGHPDTPIRRKPQVLGRRAVYRSPILLTPFRTDGSIDTDAVAAFVQSCYADAGITMADVDAGAVICTGEAARRQNARALTENLAKESGSFVCATAGHHFEAMLAAHGSGAVEISRRVDDMVINLDVGGGTAKRTLIHHGEILDTAAISVGARLLAVGPDGLLTRVEPAGWAIARAVLGREVAPGGQLTGADRQRLAEGMATLLIRFLGLAPLDGLSGELLLSDAPAPAAGPIRVVCSGGVSEYLYGWSAEDRGDLGPLLGVALRAALLERLPPRALLPPNEGIRATAIGACQFSLQASGETIYISDPTLLPLSNVPVISTPIRWDPLDPEAVRAELKRALARVDGPSPCALFLGRPRRHGYAQLGQLTKGVAAALLGEASRRPVVLVFTHNIAQMFGRALSAALPEGFPFICLDEVELGSLEYLDIGAPPPGATYIPVTVKSLVFAPRP